jgi:hypothetical protein
VITFQIVFFVFHLQPTQNSDESESSSTIMIIFSYLYTFETYLQKKTINMKILEYNFLIKLLTYVKILDTWTHHQNLSGYLLMNMNKF